MLLFGADQGDPAGQLARADRAGMNLPDRAGGVNEYGRRQKNDAVGLPRRAARVQHYVESGVRLLDELPHVSGALLLIAAVYRKYSKTTRPGFPMQRHQLREFLPAGTTPRGPEGEHHGMAAHLREGGGLPVERAQRNGRGLASLQALRLSNIGDDERRQRENQARWFSTGGGNTTER